MAIVYRVAESDTTEATQRAREQRHGNFSQLLRFSRETELMGFIHSFILLSIRSWLLQLWQETRYLQLASWRDKRVDCVVPV